VSAALRAAHVAAQEDWRHGRPALATTAAARVPLPPLPPPADDASSAPPESPTPSPRAPPLPVADELPARPSPLDAEFNAAAAAAMDLFAGWVPPSRLPTFAPLAAPRGAPPPPTPAPAPARAPPAWPLSRHGRPPAVSYADVVHADFHRDID
jgi:hypothetical protein